MRDARWTALWLIASVTLGISERSGWAQVVSGDPVADVVPLSSWDSRADGWHQSLRVGATFAFATSQNVIGADDGNTLTLGLQTRGSSTLLAGPHEWRNTLQLIENLTRTPDVAGVQKSNDRLVLDSTYLYHFRSTDWLGFYGRVHLMTSIFPQAYRDNSPDDFIIDYLDGTTETTTTDDLPLTDAFRPTTLSQGVGLTVRARSGDGFELEYLLGFGAQEVFADNQFAVVDDPDSGPITVKELQSFNQAGPESLVAVSGSFEAGRITYRLSASALLPVLRQDLTGDNATTLELASLVAAADVSFHVLSWLSIDYQFHTLRNPQLVEAFQTTNSLLFSVNLTLASQSSSSPSEGATSDGSATHGDSPS